MSDDRELTCETCFFAGEIKHRQISVHGRWQAVDMRICRLAGEAGVGHYGHQLMPLQVNGHPFWCVGHSAIAKAAV